MLRALLGGFLLLLAHAVETRAQNARARGPAYWECLVSEADMQTPWIVFINTKVITNGENEDFELFRKNTAAEFLREWHRVSVRSPKSK